MADQKKLTFSVSVDNQSLQQVQRALRELTNEANKFAQALSGANKNNGGGLLGGTGNKPGQTGNRQQPKTQLGVAILDNAQAFKSMAREGKDSLKIMSDALRNAVTEQKRELNSLDTQINKITSAYNKMSKSQQEVAQRDLLGLGTQRGTTSGNVNKLNQLLSGGARGPTMGGIGLGIAGAGISALGQNMGGQLGGVVNAGGLGVSAMGGGSGVIGKLAVVAVTEALKEIRQSPTLMVNASATHANMMAPSLMRARSGNISDALALQQIRQDPNLLKDFNQETSKAQRGFGVQALRDNMNHWDAMMLAKKERGISGFLGEVFEQANPFSNTQTQFQKRVLDQRGQDFIGKQKEADPLWQAIAGDATSNVQGKFGLMRSLRMGSGYKRSGQRGYQSGAEEFALNNPMFSAEEQAGAFQAYAGAGTGRGGHAALGSILQAQAAGIGNAAGIAGTIGRGGAGLGANFANVMRGTAGRGVDASTVGLLGGFTANAAEQFNMPGFRGEGMMGSLSAGLGGADEGVVARQNIQGFGGLNRLYQGGDNYQRARNLQISMGAQPGGSIYAQNYLANNLSQERVSEVLGGGKGGQLTGVEKSMGITREGLRGTALGIQNTPLERLINDQNLKGTGLGKYAEGLKGSGLGIKDYVSKTYKGNMQQGLDDTAAMLLATGRATSQSEAEGMARMMVQGQGRSQKGTGNLAGDFASGRGGIEEMEARTQAEVKKAELKTRNANEQRIKEGVSEEMQQYMTLKSNIVDLTKTYLESLDLASKKIRADFGLKPGTQTKGKAPK